ncbi:hypothetical protein C6499_01835 [Candidatus Poribacteria bacterium]|nr:MAG: hypothetical protein C6499_01835 [Candidatus Poribacteria bacterium]
MKTKFWIGYLFSVLVMLGGVYFVIASMSDAPLVLSDSQMKQLLGSDDTYTHWTCTQMEACFSAACLQDTLRERTGVKGCYSCESTPNNNNSTCTYLDDYCNTCITVQFVDKCGGEVDEKASEETSYRKCK